MLSNRVAYVLTPEMREKYPVPAKMVWDWFAPAPEIQAASDDDVTTVDPSEVGDEGGYILVFGIVEDPEEESEVEVQLFTPAGWETKSEQVVVANLDDERLGIVTYVHLDDNEILVEVTDEPGFHTLTQQALGFLMAYGRR